MTGAIEEISGYSIDEIIAQKCWRFLVVEEDLKAFEENVVGLAPDTQGKSDLRTSAGHVRSQNVKRFAPHLCFV